MSSQDPVISTLTDRYQTTVPDPVRRALRLSKRDRIAYTICDDGRVELTRADSETDAADPVLEAFLGFLARDMRDRPERLREVDQELARRIDGLVAGVDVDLDQPLPTDNPGDDE